MRRVLIPDSFFAIDGILNSAINLLQGMFVNEQALSIEVEKELPNLLSSRLLMESVKNGVGREVAHTKIKEIVLRYGHNLNKFKTEITEEKTIKINEITFNNILSSKIDFLASAKRHSDAIEQFIHAQTSTIKSDKSNFHIR